jgi:hypothetical protein
VDKGSGQNPGRDVTTQDMLGHRTLIVNTMQWALERMDSKRYGNKVEQTVVATVNTTMNQLPEDQAQAEIDRALGIIRGTPQIDRALAEND